MEVATQEIELGEDRMGHSSVFLKRVLIPGASGDHATAVETSNITGLDSASDLSIDIQALGDCNKLLMTTDGVSVALPRNRDGISSPHTVILADGGTTQENPTSTSAGRNRGPPASSGEGANQEDDSTPQRSFQEFLPLLLFAIGTVTILRVAAVRGKLPKA